MQHNAVKHIRHFQINENELIIVESATPTSRQITVVDIFGQCQVVFIAGSRHRLVERQIDISIASYFHIGRIGNSPLRHDDFIFPFTQTIENSAVHQFRHSLAGVDKPVATTCRRKLVEHFDTELDRFTFHQFHILRIDFHRTGLDAFFHHKLNRGFLVTDSGCHFSSSIAHGHINAVFGNFAFPAFYRPLRLNVNFFTSAVIAYGLQLDGFPFLDKQRGRGHFNTHQFRRVAIRVNTMHFQFIKRIAVSGGTAFSLHFHISGGPAHTYILDTAASADFSHSCPVGSIVGHLNFIKRCISRFPIKSDIADVFRSAKVYIYPLVIGMLASPTCQIIAVGSRLGNSSDIFIRADFDTLVKGKVFHRRCHIYIM